MIYPKTSYNDVTNKCLEIRSTIDETYGTTYKKLTKIGKISDIFVVLTIISLIFTMIHSIIFFITTVTIGALVLTIILGIISFILSKNSDDKRYNLETTMRKALSSIFRYSNGYYREFLTNNDIALDDDEFIECYKYAKLFELIDSVKSTENVLISIDNVYNETHDNEIKYDIYIENVLYKSVHIQYYSLEEFRNLVLQDFSYLDDKFKELCEFSLDKIS